MGPFSGHAISVSPQLSSVQSMALIGVPVPAMGGMPVPLETR